MYFTHFREPFENSLLNSVYLYTLFNNKETLKNCFAIRFSGYNESKENLSKLIRSPR